MYCRRCLYPLSDTVLRDEAPRGRCPECGQAFDPSWPTTYLEQPRRVAGYLWLRWVLIGSIAYPLAWVALPYVDWLSARLALGHGPVPSQDDPADCGLWLLRSLFFLGACAGFAVMVAAAVAVVVGLILRPRGWWWLVPLVVAAWGGVIALFLTDPGDVLLWYGD